MPKIVDHDAYRHELLKASREIVARVGYEALSMKRLAQGLDISIGLIYHYFESKEDWFVSLVAHYSVEAFERLVREVPIGGSVSDRAALLITHINKHKHSYANMISVISDYVRISDTEKKEVSAELALVADQLYEYFATLFDNDTPTARALVSHLVGMIMTDRLDPRGLDITAQLPYIRSLLGCAVSLENGKESG